MTHGPRNNQLDFGGDLYYNHDPEIFMGFFICHCEPYKNPTIKQENPQWRFALNRVLFGLLIFCRICLFNKNKTTNRNMGKTILQLWGTSDGQNEWALHEKTRCVAMPSLTAARWVGQNSGLIFRSLWTKVHRIKFACAGVSVVCNTVFRLTTSCCVPEICAIKSRNRDEILMFLACKISGEGTSKFLTEFYKSGSPSIVAVCWWSAKWPRTLSAEKKRKKI